MIKPNVKIVHMEDWEVCYVDGVKVAEADIIDAATMARVLTGLEPEEYTLDNQFDDNYDGTTPGIFKPEGLTPI